VREICFTAGSSQASRNEPPPVIGRVHLGPDSLHQLLLDPLEGGAKEVALVREVVVERPAGDLGASDDLLCADPGIAALGEQLERRLHEGIAGRLRLGLAAAGTSSGGGS
jgi:hypothetical protein